MPLPSSIAPVFLHLRLHREDCSSLPGNVSHPPICVIGIPKHRCVRCLLNPSGSAAFQTVGEHSVTAADLLLVTTGRRWREQWPPLRAQKSMCMATSNYSRFGIFLVHCRDSNTFQLHVYIFTGTCRLQGEMSQDPNKLVPTVPVL